MKTSAEQMEKGWGLHFSAVLSNVHSATNANVSWVFAGLGWKRRERSLQNITKSINNWRENNEHLAKHWEHIGNAIYGNAAFFLTVSTWKTKGMIAKKIQNHQKLCQKQWKLQQNKWKKAGDCISQQCSAVLSSAQSTTNFEVSWVFAGERAENEPNKYHKIHQKLRNNNKKWTKTMGTHTHTKQMEEGGELDFSAAHSSTLSSTQQHSAVLTICNQFQGFLTFSRVRDEKGENETKKNAKSIQTIWKKMKSGQNNGKTHTKQMEKGWELDFPAALSSTQQHSAVLNLQPISRFPDFLQGQRWKRWERSQKKAQNPSKQWENTHKTNGKRPGIVFLTILKVFWLFAGSGVKKVRTKPKKKQNPSKIEEKQWYLDKTMGKTVGMLLKCRFFFADPRRTNWEWWQREWWQKTTKTIKSCGKSHENFSKTNGKRLGIAFLSSAQQCSIYN